MAPKLKQTLIQDWVLELDPYSQSTLLSILRGIDTEDTDLKQVTKMLRHLIVNNLNSSNKYATNNIVDIDTVLIPTILQSTLLGSKHFYDHLLAAILIITHRHPNAYTKLYWNSVLTKLNSIVMPPKLLLDACTEYNELSAKIKSLKDYIETTSVSVDKIYYGVEIPVEWCSDYVPCELNNDGIPDYGISTKLEPSDVKAVTQCDFMVGYLNSLYDRITNNTDSYEYVNYDIDNILFKIK